MPTLDDSPDFASGTFPPGPRVSPEQEVDEPESEWGSVVDELFADAAKSPRVRVQALGRRAAQMLSDLDTLVVRDRKIAAAEEALAKLKRGEA